MSLLMVNGIADTARHFITFIKLILLVWKFFLGLALEITILNVIMESVYQLIGFVIPQMIAVMEVMKRIVSIKFVSLRYNLPQTIISTVDLEFRW